MKIPVWFWWVAGIVVAYLVFRAVQQNQQQASVSAPTQNFSSSSSSTGLNSILTTILPDYSDQMED